MRKILDMLACLLLATVLASAVLGPTHATPPNTLMGSVAVCDPYSPQNCMVPGAGGYAYTPLTPMQANLAIVASTALTVPSGATYAVACAAGTNVNYTTDGTTTPTASVGMPLLQNQCVSLSGSTVISNFRAIQQSATATLNVSYYK